MNFAKYHSPTKRSKGRLHGETAACEAEIQRGKYIVSLEHPVVPESKKCSMVTFGTM